MRGAAAGGVPVRLDYLADGNWKPLGQWVTDDDGVIAGDGLSPGGRGMHRLTYDLDGKYKEFKAALGVDEVVGGDSHAEVKIEGDGKELFSAIVARKDEPRQVALNVRGVKLLRIVVRSTGLLTLGDHVDLVEACISK